MMVVVESNTTHSIIMKGGVLMVDLDTLNKIVKESGMTYKAIGEKSGIEPYTLSRRLADGKFTADEIVGLSKALRLKKSERNAIFLSPSVTKNNAKDGAV